MRLFSLKFTITVLFFAAFLSCKKDNEIDKRDKYAGKYTGIQIYVDYQQGINDTSYIDIYLKKFDTDSISALELDLPNTNQMYYYDIINDSLIYHGYFYHCPTLSIKGDSLFCEWSPSLAPRITIYKAVKVK